MAKKYLDRIQHIQNYANTYLKEEVKERMLLLMEKSEEHGGHAIKKHVGRTYEELMERYGEENDLRMSSSFWNINDAKRMIEKFLEDEYNRLDLTEWLLSPREKEDLILTSENFEENTGYGCNRYGQELILTEICLVFSKRTLKDGSTFWNIKTAYPTEES